MTFQEMGLSERLLKSLDHAGFEAPTPIQAGAIGPALLGKDIVGCAATGTGKTAAFLLPIIEQLERRPHFHQRKTRVLILAPTRELALQIGEQAQRFGTDQIRSAVVIGGVGMGPQTDAFKKGVEFIIATPGRLNDHLDSGSAKLDGIEFLVLDEADRMLDMGFKPQLDRILARVPKQRQTFLFSATMGGEVGDFAARHLKAPVKVEIARSGTTAERATQQVFLVGQEEKLALLLALLEQDGLSTLVFTRTKRRADKVAKMLARGGHKAAVIHADRSQGQRKHALDAFKSGEARVLVATDIAARGIDVADIGHVINFDLPHVPEDYVHRIGRTARHEASGRASSFASPDEHDLLRGIEKLTRKSVARAAVPRESEAFQSEVKRGTAAREKNFQNAPQRPHGGGGGGRRPQGGGGGPRRQGGGGGRSSGGGGGGGKSSGGGGITSGSWGPKRRR